MSGSILYPLEKVELPTNLLAITIIISLGIAQAAIGITDTDPHF